jgi:hypothetical protein
MALAALRTGGMFSTRGGASGVKDDNPEPSTFPDVVVTAVELAGAVPRGAVVVVVAADEVWAFWPSLTGKSVRRTGSCEVW